MPVRTDSDTLARTVSDVLTGAPKKDSRENHPCCRDLRRKSVDRRGAE